MAYNQVNGTDVAVATSMTSNSSLRRLNVASNRSSSLPSSPVLGPRSVSSSASIDWTRAYASVPYSTALRKNGSLPPLSLRELDKTGSSYSSTHAAVGTCADSGWGSGRPTQMGAVPVTSGSLSKALSLQRSDEECVFPFSPSAKNPAITKRLRPVPIIATYNPNAPLLTRPAYNSAQPSPTSRTDSTCSQYLSILESPRSPDSPPLMHQRNASMTKDDFNSEQACTARRPSIPSPAPLAWTSTNPISTGKCKSFSVPASPNLDGTLATGSTPEQPTTSPDRRLDFELSSHDWSALLHAYRHTKDVEISERALVAPSYRFRPSMSSSTTTSVSSASSPSAASGSLKTIPR